MPIFIITNICDLLKYRNVLEHKTQVIILCASTMEVCQFTCFGEVCSKAAQSLPRLPQA